MTTSSLPIYALDPGFQVSPNNVPYIILDYSKEHMDPFNAFQMLALRSRVEQAYFEETNRRAVINVADLCESPYGDLVLIMYLTEVL